MYDVHTMFEALARTAAETPGGLDAMMAESVSVRWAARNGLWTFGVSDADGLFKAVEDYTMEGLAERITCPMLVLEAESDQFFAGQPQRIFDALTCPKELIAFPEAEGGGEHCHEGAVALWHQRTFDWPGTTFAM
ncbi:hypothetical protein ACGFSB_32625 [Streptomyces sp. NPDC048441]|uniref:hypothetical protein n=1 Tax=Streptomyces sp. NPDC048441 TaxID=3365552 RepID=UPI003714CFC0